MLAIGCIGSTQGYGEHNVFESHDDKYVESIGGAMPWLGQNCGSRYDEAQKAPTNERRWCENRSAEGAKGVEFGEGCSPSQPTRESGERRELLSCCGGLDLLPRFQPVWRTRPMGPTQGMG